MLKHQYKSINEINEWASVESQFIEKQKVFKSLISRFASNYSFNAADIEKSLQYELVRVQYSVAQKSKFEKPNLFFSALIYAMIFSSLIILFPIFWIFDICTKKSTYDLLYDEMQDERSVYSRFYKQIDRNLPKKTKVALLFTSFSIRKNKMNIKNIKDNNRNVIDIRNRTKFYHHKAVFKVINKDLKSLIFLYKLSKENNLDLIYLYLRLIRRFLMYSSFVSNVKAKILVSALDYYWNPLRYLCYKAKIKNIILIQHNNKDNYLFGRLFPYCDYYYAHSNDSLSKIEGVEFAEKHGVGSFQLSPFLEKKEIEHDLLFINNTVNDNLKDGTPLLDQKKLIEEHDILILNLKKYLINNKSIKCIYMSKPTYMAVAPASNIKQNFASLTNIKFIEAYGSETFYKIQSSKLLINMYSGVGKEAYGLDKRVLWINYNGCCDLFEIDTQEENLHVMVSDNSYEAFEKRVNLLLSENVEVDQHYKKLKEKYMNIEENPAKIVARKIDQLLKGS